MNETGSSQHISAEAVPLDAAASSREGRGMTDPVERVARALCEAAGLNWDAQADPMTSGSGSDEEQEGYRAQALAAIAAMPGEPVTWQKRPTFGGYRVWTECIADPEEHDFWRQQEYELRPLYAAPAMPVTDAVREAIQYLRDIESHMMANDIDIQMGDHLPPTIIADRLESALCHPSQGGWQPIETAPKDGTEVLVYVPRRMGALYMAAANVTGVQWWSRNLGAIVPSHWQPLPAPPEVQS